MEKKLQRIPYEGAVAGVCAGLGEYLRVDKTWVRIAFILSVFFAGYGIGLLGPIVYVVLWIVLPVKTFTLPQDPFDVDYRTPEAQPATSQGYHPPSTWDMGTMPHSKTPRTSKDRYVAGSILLAVGLFFLLHQLDIFYWRDLARFWPVLLIAVGLACIVSAFTKQPKHPTHSADPVFKKAEHENHHTGDDGEEDVHPK